MGGSVGSNSHADERGLGFRWQLSVQHWIPLRMATATCLRRAQQYGPATFRDKRTAGPFTRDKISTIDAGMRMQRSGLESMLGSTSTHNSRQILHSYDARS